MFVVWLVCLSSSPLARAQSASPPAPTLEGGAEQVSTNGALQLTWTACDNADCEFELQEARSASFDQPLTLYRGTMPSWYTSGRVDGLSHLRVRARVVGPEDALGPWSPWSAAQVLRVEHHDPRAALALFGVGALLFVITAVTLVINTRREDRAQEVTQS